MSADEHEQASPVEDDDEEVRKLKVCIELKGLRLSKPAAGSASPEGSQNKQERAWSQFNLVAPGQSLRDHKIRASEADDRAAAQKADINRKWGCEKLLNGKNEPAAISTAAVSEFSSGNGNMSLALPHCLTEPSVVWGISREEAKLRYGIFPAARGTLGASESEPVD